MLNSVRYRTLTPLQLYFLSCVLCYYFYVCILHLCILQIQQCIVIIITLYNLVAFTKAGRRKESKYLFIMFVILTFLFNISCSYYLFLWIQVAIWCDFPRMTAVLAGLSLTSFFTNLSVNLCASVRTTTSCQAPVIASTVFEASLCGSNIDKALVNCHFPWFSLINQLAYGLVYCFLEAPRLFSLPCH